MLWITDRPAQRRKATNEVREAITKAINEANETTVREKAVFEGKTLHVLPSDDVQPPEKPPAQKQKSTKKTKK